MKITTICILASAFFLTSCGGGGAGSTTGGNDGGAVNPALIFEFAVPPLHARVFNLDSFSADTENHFNPGETISLIWDKDLYFSGDNPFLGLLDQYLYDSSVYLSNDTVLSVETDLKLFAVECSFPMTLEHACGETAHFQCLYAKDNANTISCTSIPLGRTNGFIDVIVDTTTFLDVVPKDAHVIIKSCLREDPSNCAEANYPLKLLQLMKKAYKRPSYIADCDDQYQLKNAIDTMILDLLKNLETGYDLNINVVFEGVFNGIIITPAGKFDAILISDGYEINIGSINI